MKTCLLCGTKAATEAPTCAACGEATWSPAAKAEVEPKANDAKPSPAMGGADVEAPIADDAEAGAGPSEPASPRKTKRGSR